MKKTPSNAIAVTGRGCILPGAPNLKEFWARICEGLPLFKNLPSNRWQRELYFSADRNAVDKTYSTLATTVEDEWLQDIADKAKEDYHAYTRSHWMTLGALTQALEECSPYDWKPKRVALILGCMSCDESVGQATLLNSAPDLKAYHAATTNQSPTRESTINRVFSSFSPQPTLEQNKYFTTSVLDKLQHHLGIKGTSFLLDAACASSLAAVDIGMQLLQRNEADVVITGGFEANLGPETYIPFARLGVLAKETSLPFDKKSEGIVQGEGAVILVLERLSDAKAKNKKIWGVLIGCGGSSNGSESSLVSPSVNGQLKAIEMAELKIAMGDTRYIECHGTGTPLGDLTELEALKTAFGASKQPIALGSVKAIIGHTKGTAGAAGILKCLLMLEHQCIPDSKYITDLVTPLDATPLYFPQVPEPLLRENTRLRVCSSGFGGSNYHLVIDKFEPQLELEPRTSNESNVLTIAESSFSVAEAKELSKLRAFKIPPKVLKDVDPIQLTALLATSEILERNLIYETDRMLIISASHNGTDTMHDLTLKLRLAELYPFIEAQDENLVTELEEYSTKLIHINSEIWGILNSVTSGRISSEFGSTAKNYHIDAGYDSLPPAIAVAKSELALGNADIALIVEVCEEPINPPTKVKRHGVRCQILTNAEYWNRTHPTKQPKTSETIGFVFNGQGSAFPGMMVEYADHSIFRKFFKIADNLAREKNLPPISAYVVCPQRLSPGQISKIQNAALYTSQIVAAHLLAAQTVVPNALTGHSFGEFAVLVFSGVLNFETGLKLVLLRDSICPPTNEAGYMIAVSASPDRIRDILGLTGYFICNENALNQTVISTTWDKVPDIECIFKLNKLAFRRLEIPQPYHSPLLNEAAERMNGLLDGALSRIESPKIPFFSSVLKCWINETNFNQTQLQEIVRRQLVEPVNFIHQIQALAENCSKLVEIGGKSILEKLIRENSKIETESYHQLLTPTKTGLKKNSENQATLSLPTLELVNRILAKITGYRVEEIRLEDRLQDDLGVDSIKTTEIVISIMDELAIPRSTAWMGSPMKTVEDLARLVENGATNWDYSQVEMGETFKSFNCSKEQWLHEPYPAREQRTKNWDTVEFIELASLVSHGEHQRDHYQNPPPENLDTLTAITRLLEKKVISGATLVEKDFVFFASGMKQATIPKIPEILFRLKETLAKLHGLRSVAIVTAGPTNADTNAIAALFKSLKKENYLEFFTHVHFSNPDEAEHWQNLAFLELDLGLSSEVQYRSNERFVKRLIAAPSAPSSANCHIKKDSVIVAIGGARGITYSLVSQLNQEFRCRIHLIGRSEETLLSAPLEALRLKNPNVVYHQCDASKRELLLPLLRSIYKQEGRIDLIIGGAGTEKSQWYLKKSETDITDEISNKIYPNFNLIEATREIPIKALFLFSSVIGRFGNRGQAVYAYANAYTEALLSEANADTRCLCLEWPPWDQLGMTADPHIFQQLKAAGVAMLKAERAYEFFRNELLSRETGTMAFWCPEDQVLYEGALVAGSSSLPLFKNTSDGLICTHTLRAGEFDFLKDHKIDGEIHLPAAALITMGLVIGRTSLQRIPVIQNFNVWRPIKQNTDELQIEAKLQSRENVGNLHFQCGGPFASLEISKKPQDFEVNFLATERTLRKSITKSEIYGNGRLFHGPSLQVLTKVDCFTHGWYSGIIHPPSDISFLAPWGNWITVLDGVFQVLAIAGAQDFGVVGLPKGVEQLEFFCDTLEVKERSIEMCQVELKGDTLLADAVVRNHNNGQLILQLHRIAFGVRPILVDQKQ